MSARKPTKSERAAKRRAKERAAKRDLRQPLKPLDIWAIEVNEAYLSLIKHGFTKEQAMDYVTSTFHKPSVPDWSHENPDFDYEEDEDE